MKTAAIILIPAYEPDEKLLSLVRALRHAQPEFAVVIIDDGSGSIYRPIFSHADDLGCDVVRHTQNFGKGGALKTGLAYISQRFPGHDVVCADGDGQHSVVDILRIAEQLRHSAGAIVLGQRHFSGGTVPRRSKWGNTATRWMFRLATGRLIQDTQTGLRDYPANLLPWLQTVPGERYEYELNILLHAADAGLIIENLSISTIYLEENKSSHFRPLIDSARIYGLLVKFAASSLTAFTIDTVTLLLLNALTGSLLLAVVGARVLSSAVNFAVNRRVVFERGREGRTTAAAAQYFVLVIGLLGVNYTALLASQAAGLPLLPAKLVTELVLFGISFAVQQRVIFRSSRSGSASAGPDIHVPGLHETVGELEKSTG